jgi:4-amino-4-deoxy-L-arabinose transferase-like glycosyltransferase
MSKFIKWNYLILFIILALSLFLRFYKLNVNPPSLDWDEASLGYNAYSILKTGADEYGNKLPLSIRSFDDYKPAVYVYLDVPSVALFGLNETGVRFPSALIGFLSVIAVYFSVKEVFNNWDNDSKEKLALLSAFFWGISPWSLQFSRAAFEGNVGLFFFILGLLIFLKSLRNPKLVFLSAASFVLSLYSYHSFRLIIPLFAVVALIYFWREIWASKKYFILGCFFAAILTIPILLSFTGTSGSAARLSMVSLFSDTTVISNSVKETQRDQLNKDLVGSVFDNRRLVYSLAVAKSYFAHWNPDFLFFHGDSGVQHHAVNMGMLYLWDLPFILIGLYALLNKRTKRSLLLLIIFLIAPLPAAISTGSPHPVRAIAMAPELSIFAALGVYYLFFQDKKIRNKIFLSVVSLLLLFNFAYYLHQYYVNTPVEYGYFWQYGNKQAVLDAKSLEDKYSKVIFTYTYDQPYIYYLFYNKTDPSWYQKNWNYLGTGQVERMRRVIGKYEFRNINWGQDKTLKNTLLIGSPQEIPANAHGLIKTIYYLDGTVAYRIVGT